MSETPIIFALLALIYAIIMFLLPFFIMRIRREVIAINQKMSRVEDLLVQLAGKPPLASAAAPKTDDRERLLKVCENCGRKNAIREVKCVGCGDVLQ
ncbi:MAG: hypothetical protein MUC57_03675 [Desulfobacterales bacterium]|jgi:hypothetical protein|nr:hypothetical protein [Desulfobacterales bacterium]